MLFICIGRPFTLTQNMCIGRSPQLTICRRFLLFKQATNPKRNSIEDGTQSPNNNKKHAVANERKSTFIRSEKKQIFDLILVCLLYAMQQTLLFSHLNDRAFLSIFFSFSLSLLFRLSVRFSLCHWISRLILLVFFVCLLHAHEIYHFVCFVCLVIRIVDVALCWLHSGLNWLNFDFGNFQWNDKKVRRKERIQYDVSVCAHFDERMTWKGKRIRIEMISMIYKTTQKDNKRWKCIENSLNFAVEWHLIRHLRTSYIFEST